MKLFAVLLLCAQLFSCRADLHLVQDANCNDLQIFEAMDLALKKYNTGKKEGNQFALHRITEASTTTEDNRDQQYFVTYETIESSCPVNNGKEWQDCQYRPATEAETGICRAHVYIKKLQKTIISQHCNITSGKFVCEQAGFRQTQTRSDNETLVTFVSLHTSCFCSQGTVTGEDSTFALEGVSDWDNSNGEGPVISTQYVCLGCPHPIPSNSKDLLPILRRAIQKFNDESNHSKLFKVEEVKKATRQVVAGWVYEIEYTIKETNCFKSESTDLNPHCGIGEVSGTCTASVLVSINSSITSIDQRCKFTDEIVPPPIRRCPGCPVPMEINSTDLVEPLTHSINTFNSENNHTFLYKVGLIHSATKQVVSGMKYVVIFTIELTNCSKEDNDHLHDGCQFDGKSATRAGIRGLSPFRSVGKIQREVGHPPGQGKGHGHGHGQGHEHGKGHEQGHKCEHPIGKKPKHDKKKCKHNDNRESSEESHERYTTKPVLPVSANIPARPKPTSEAGVKKPGVLATTHYTEETTPLAAVIPMIPILPVEKPGGLATTHYTEETTTLAAVIPIIPILPVESEIPGLLPNLPEVLLPDLPEPPTPMCPGEPWKPKPLLPPSLSPTPEVLKDEDLLLGAHEETTLAIEKSRPALPSSSGAFGDDDLLAAFT